MTSNKRGCEAHTPSLAPPIEASPQLIDSHFGRPYGGVGRPSPNETKPNGRSRDQKFDSVPTNEPTDKRAASSEAARVLCRGPFPPGSPRITRDHFCPRVPATLTPLPMIRL